MTKLCKCCFAEIPKKHKFLFCEDCIEEGVSVLGGQDVNLKTGKPINNNNKPFKDKNEEWISVPSPFKPYKEGV